MYLHGIVYGNCYLYWKVYENMHIFGWNLKQIKFLLLPNMM